MKVKYTPGPWQHDGDGDFVSVDMDASKMICDIRGWGWLQKMGEKKAHETQIANGKLIAAAPDLLKELQHLVRLLEPLEKDGGLDVPGLATLNGARAAIKKATE